jgi:hypothetical protein
VCARVPARSFAVAACDTSVTVPCHSTRDQIFGRSLELHPVVVLMALAFWFAIWGVVGAILSIPVTAIIRIVLSHTNHPYAHVVIRLLEGVCAPLWLFARRHTTRLDACVTTLCMHVFVCACACACACVCAAGHIGLEDVEIVRQIGTAEVDGDDGSAGGDSGDEETGGAAVVTSSPCVSGSLQDSSVGGGAVEALHRPSTSPDTDRPTSDTPFSDVDVIVTK